MSVPVYKTVIKDIPTSIVNNPKATYAPQNTLKQSKLVYQPKTSAINQKQMGSGFGGGDPNAGHNPTVSEYIFNPAITQLNPPKEKTKMEFSEPIIDEETIYSAHDSSKGEAFVNKMQSELETLKKASQKYKEEKKKRREEEEKKQAMHLIPQPNTHKKQNYITNEEINQKKEKILKDFEESKESFYAKKKKDKENLTKYLQLNDGLIDMQKTDDLFKNQEANQNTQDIELNQTEIANVLEKNQSNKKLLNTKKNPINRKGYNNNKPIEIKDEKFIKRYAKYILLKEIQNDIMGNNYIDEDQFKFGLQTNMSEETLQTGLLNSRRMSKYPKSNMNEASSYMQSEMKLPNNNNMQSYIAFCKMIFTLLDKEKKGVISKEQVLKEIALDNQILQDLGFESTENFLLLINIFEPIQSTKKEELCENDFISFLLSQTEFKDDVYNLLFKPTGGVFNKNQFGKKKGRRRKNKNGDIDEVEISEDSDSDLPGLRTHVFDFLECPDIFEKLERLNQILENTKSYNLKTKLGTNDCGYGKREPIKMRLKLNNEKIRISYQQYLMFIRKFQTKNQINFTIPEPFEFLKRDYMQHKLEKIQKILEEKVKEYEEITSHPFHAIKLKEGIWGNQMEGIIERERNERMMRQEKIKERIVAEMKPFSFYDEDERKYMERLRRECPAPVFPPFRAGAIKWLSQINILDDIKDREEKERKKRIIERRDKLMNASKLPPRMQAAKEEYEKKKKQQQKEERIKRQKEKYVFKANNVPDFAKLQNDFTNKLEEMKSKFTPTKQEPFFMHEPKINVDLYPVDVNNDPNGKNPQRHTNIKQVIKKMQKKPNIEPPTTKGLEGLMKVNREKIEKREKEKKALEEEEKERRNRSKKMATKVKKALKEMEKQSNKEQKKRVNEIKEGMKKTTQEYEKELKRRMDRVNNRPLLLERMEKKKEFKKQESPDKIVEQSNDSDASNDNMNEFKNNKEEEKEDNNNNEEMEQQMEQQMEEGGEEEGGEEEGGEEEGRDEEGREEEGRDEEGREEEGRDANIDYMENQDEAEEREEEEEMENEDRKTGEYEEEGVEMIEKDYQNLNHKDLEESQEDDMAPNNENDEEDENFEENKINMSI